MQPAGVPIITQPDPAPAPSMSLPAPVGQQPGNFEYYAPAPYSDEYYAQPAPFTKPRPQMMANENPPAHGYVQQPHAYNPNESTGASVTAEGAGLCAACLAFCACCSLDNCLL